MTREEFEYAIKSCGCFIYRGQTYYEESELIKAFEDMGLIEQEPKTDVLDKIRAEIQENINYNKKMNYQGIVAGLLLALNIIDKYRNEVNHEADN